MRRADRSASGYATGRSKEERSLALESLDALLQLRGKKTNLLRGQYANEEAAMENLFPPS